MSDNVSSDYPGKFEDTKVINYYYNHDDVTLDIVCESDKYRPSYANATDACMDLKVRIPEGRLVIKPNSVSYALGTGIKVSVPEGMVMMIFPRSSTGFKLGCRLVNSTGIIDSGYRDEIKVKLHNFSDKDVAIHDGDRIAQFMILPVPGINLNEVEDDENFRTGDRGGGIGSTGK